MAPWRVFAAVAALGCLAIGPAAPSALGATALSARVPGQRVWIKHYDVTGPDYDEAFALGVSPNGTAVFVTGQSLGVQTGIDYATVAYARNGRPLWASRYNAPAGGSDYAYALVVSPDGSRVFVTGGSGTDQDQDFATVAYDAVTGIQLWASRYAGPSGTDVAQSMAVSRDGSTIFVAGRSEGASGDNDYATVAYDAGSGAELWVSRFDDGSNDYANALAVSPDGSQVFVTGETDGLTDGDYLTVAYDAATGESLWTSRYDGPAHLYDSPNAMSVDPAGALVYVTGRSTEVADDYATIAYDTATGRQVWAARYDGPSGVIDIAEAIGVAPDGSRVYVTGLSSSPSQGDIATVAYDGLTGTQIWVTRYAPQGTESVSALVVSPDGAHVYVEGTVTDGTSDNYATLSYDAAAGTQVWVATLDTPWHGYDNSTSIGISPDGGRVFVTGRSQRPNSDYAYLTVAYQA